MYRFKDCEATPSVEWFEYSLLRESGLIQLAMRLQEGEYSFFVSYRQTVRSLKLL